MQGKDWIKEKQLNWAKRNNVALNSQYIFYTSGLPGNLLLQGLNNETEKDFQEADGGELTSNNSSTSKMQALHSSSALAVNVFDYWRQEGKSVLSIMESCNLISKSNRDPYKLRFEQKFYIFGPQSRPANVDIVFYGENTNEKIFILESKFSEPYQKKNKKMKEKYFENEAIWTELHNLRNEATSLDEYCYLDAGQLIKHLLGVLKKKEYNKRSITLGYIYYDVPGEIGKRHFDEIMRFEKVIKADGVRFKHITYQEVIANLLRDYYEGNEKYCNYLADRYL